jgi:MoaA/NifB/PqqE/SkfB family radical SAM enzyme
MASPCLTTHEIDSVKTTPVKIKQLLLLLMGLLNGRRAYTGPIFVVVDITRRCNLRCQGCPYHFSKRDVNLVDPSVDDISMKIIYRLSRELLQMGTIGVILCGNGEPMLHPGLIDIITAFKRQALNVHLFTNGTRLDEKMASRLIRVGLDRLTVSIWAGTPEGYAKSHPRNPPGTFKEIVRNVAHMSGLKETLGEELPKVYLKHICTEPTHQEVNEIIDLAHITGCNGVVFSPFNPQGDDAGADALGRNNVASYLNDLQHARKRMRALSLDHNIFKDGIVNQYRLGRKVWRSVHCYIAWYQSRARVDGGVMPCCYCDMLLGDLNTHTMKEIWNSETYVEFRDRTRTLDGLASLSRSCHCDWCCYYAQNIRIHRIFKWFRPFRVK